MANTLCIKRNTTNPGTPVVNQLKGGKAGGGGTYVVA